MPSKADVDQFRAAQDVLVTGARNDLRRVWGRLDLTAPLTARTTLEQVWPPIVTKWGAAAAAAAAHWLSARLEFRAVVPVTQPISDDAANVDLRWGLAALFARNPAQSLATLGLVLDRLVKQSARDTVDATCNESGVAYARVPGPGDTCAYCIRQAARGAVHAQAEAYHNGCGCVPTPIRDADDLPAGYDIGKLSGMYDAARRQADSGSEAAILAKLRELYDIK